MQRTSALLGLAALLLAGCSSAPPTGTLAPTSYAIPGFDGDANVVYTPFSSGGNPANCETAPQNPQCQTTQCAQDPLVGQVPPGTVPGSPPVAPCTPASTRVFANFTLPAAGTQAYKLYFVGGPAGEAEIGDLGGTDGNFTLAKAFSEDLTGKHAGMELRLSGYVVATAPASGGLQAFTPTPLSGIKVEATFEGTTLAAKVSGLQENGTYVGRLYTKDEAGKATVGESFPVRNGNVSFTTTQKAAIAEYAEFHIHVGDSSLNLYKAEIKADE